MSVPASISVAASLDKSRLSGGDAILSLVKITWPDGTLLRLVNNVGDVVFDTGDGSGPQTFTAFYWEFGELTETSEGSIPQWAVKVSNVSRAVEALVEQYSGGVGGNVVVYMVQASRLKREPDLELEFDIVGSSSDAKLISFNLGAESPFRIIFGRHTYSADTCRWRYKSGLGCTYAGPLPSCSLRMNDPNGCRAHFAAGAVLPFGAYPGVDSNGMRAVTK